MQIVIPMSGVGSRFKAAGYDTLKPMISIAGKPMIEYVVDMFPGNHSYIFICREDHNEQYGFTEYFKTFCPNSTVVLIKPPYLKLGPVYAALQAEAYIRPDEPVMLSYCDYYMKWSFADFMKNMDESGDDGNIICYTGFHPHLLPVKNLYASCLIDENKQLIEIKEKFTFEEDKSKGFHSAGPYYFKRGDTMLSYFKEAMELDLSVNGEYYVSVVYNLLVRDKLKVGVYDNVSHLCQWGTPEDLEEYLYWQSIFKDNSYL